MIQSLAGYYGWIFVTLEPISTIAGAFAGFYSPYYLLNAQIPEARSPPLEINTLIAVLQLANAYLLLALISSFVLRTTREEQTVKWLLGALLIGDIGHVSASVRAMGESFWNISQWTPVVLGNVPFTVSMC